MKNIKLLYGFLILGILFITLVSGILINTFSNGLTSSNLTFTGDENISLNLSIPYNAETVSAVMNLSGNDLNDNCYQESANVSNETGIDGNCNLNYSGGYSATCSNTGNAPCPSAAYDGNWSTYNNNIDDFYMNYTKPLASISANWSIGTGGTTLLITNFTIPSSCFDYFSNQINLYLEEYRLSGQQKVFVYCYNGTYVKFGQTAYVTSSSSMINEEAIYWNISAITSPYIQINNTNIWNYTGEFNSTFSPSKTDDFSSILNTALNGGACDCTGCVLSSTECLISTLFHSDTAGLLEWSALAIDYTPAPFPTLESPANDSYSPATKTFNCSATDEEGLTNMTFYFWNSTGDLNLSTTISLTGTDNSTTYEMTFNSTDTFTWGCSAFNNNSRSWWADANFTINVDIDDPVINSLSPSDNSWENDIENNVTFYYTPSHSTDTIDTCHLYSNFTGTWEINQTDNSINTSNQNNFTINLSSLAEESYKWTVWCNTTSTGNSAYSQSGNYTINIDTILPNVTINSITTTTDSKTLWFNHTTTDTNIDTCKYSIFDSTGGIDGSNENVSFTCGTNLRVNVTVTDFATYNLTIYANDSASNENSTTTAFTTSESSDTPTGGGGATTTTTEDLGFCGDGVCNELRGETFFNCPEDCSQEFTFPNLDEMFFNCFDDDENTTCVWTTNPGLLLVLGFMVSLFIFTILFDFNPEAKGVKKWVVKKKFKRKKWKR